MSLYEYYKPRLKEKSDEYSRLIRHRVLMVMRSIVERHPEITSRKEFADSINTRQASVSRWEANKGMPTIENIADICHVYGVAPAYLILGQGSVWGDAELMVRMEMAERRIAEIEKYLNIKTTVPSHKLSKADKKRLKNKY